MNKKEKGFIKLAILALKKESRVYAFDAHLYERGVGGVRAKMAYEKYSKIKEAIEYYTGIMNE